MKWIREFLKNRKKSKAKERLSSSGIKYTRTKFGAGVFISTDNTRVIPHKMLFPDDYSREELRAIADYMEAFPECSLFDDGSGDVCR